MNTQLKIFTILTFFLLVVTSLEAQTNSGSITMTDNDWIYDWDCDCGDYYKNYTISVSPNTPIKINCTFYTYDYLGIYTNDNGIYKNYMSLYEPTNGTQAATIISSTGTIYISLYWGYNTMNTGDPVFEINYSVDPNYTISTNPSIIQNDQYIGGKLGIGVQPKEKLEVNGSAILNNKLTLGTSSISSDSKFYLYNNTDYYSQRIYNYKSSTSPTFGLYSYASNYSGNVYGLYSSVGGQTGKKWAGYFTGGDVAVMSGNLGIGTTTPKAHLDITGGSGGLAITGTNLDPYFSDKLLPFKNSRKLILGWNYSGGRGEQSIITNGPASLVGGFSFYNYKDDATTATHLMTIEGSGRVGIGTPTPAEKLTIAGDHNNTKMRLYSTGNGSDQPANLSLWASEPGLTYCGTGIGYNVNGSPHYGRIDNSRGSSYIRFLPGETKFMFQTALATDVDALTINDNGKVGIGTSVIPTEFKLAVAGKIIAEEVVVKLQSAWPDFVFDQDYSLKPLHEVEQFVRTNKHLPGIPSAAQVEEKGLSMGEMHNKLLLKIEELTLYIIELQKTNEHQNAKIEQLEKSLK